MDGPRVSAGDSSNSGGSSTRSSREAGSAHDEKPDRVPFGYWFVVGGRGPPPSWVNFRRMVKSRVEQGKAEAELKAVTKEAKKKGHVEWEKSGEYQSLKQPGHSHQLRKWYRELEATKKKT